MAKDLADKTKPPRKPSQGAISMEEALATLIRRNEELVSLNKSKDEFIAITSHQLRTPATGVKQYLGLLLEGYAEPLTKNQRLFLEKAYENNERQLHIVDDILRIAQLDLDKINLELAYIDVGEVLQDAIDNLQGRLKERDQKVQIIKRQEPLLARLDAENFRMVMENLLENASNYSAEGKKIIIKFNKLKNQSVHITIRDEGVGINNNDLSKLFQKFSRIDNPRSHTVSGTGLGLYFSKKIIELHGGRISVKSTVGKGTSFIITLPS